MIRTASYDNPLIGEFLSASFVDMMSHFCDTDIMDPCDNDDGRCIITGDEWRSVSDDFVLTTLFSAFDAFSYTGGTIFLKKKIVQLVKIAKSEKIIQLDLVSELILYLIGCYCDDLEWMENNRPITPYSHFDFDKKAELLDSLCDQTEECNEEYESEVKTAFNSFGDLMDADREETVNIFWDLDYTSLMEDAVPEGIVTLYTAFSDYDRSDYMRPWEDIGEAVPAAVIAALDKVEKEAQLYGGLTAMREYNHIAYIKRMQQLMAGETISVIDKAKIEWYNALQRVLNAGFDLDKNSARLLLIAVEEFKNSK